VDELSKKLQENQWTASILESPCPLVKRCLFYFDTSLPNLDSKKPNHYDRTTKMMPRKLSTTSFTLIDEIHKLEHLQDQHGEEANQALEVL